MVDRLSSRLGVKLFILLTAVITLSIVPLAYTSLKAISSYGTEVSELHEHQIRTHAFSYLKRITRERAARYQALFTRMSGSAGLLGSLAATIYSDLSFYSTRPMYGYQYSILPENGFWANSINDPVISLYWGSEEIHDEAREELRALTHMTPLFTQILEENPEAIASHMITMSGIGQYCTHEQKNKETAFSLPPLSLFDLRDGEPVTVFTRSADLSAGVRWTNVYKDDVNEGLMLTAAAPIYTADGMFHGVTGIDVPLNTIVEDILRIDEAEPERTILFAFLLDNNGRLIAFPESYYERFGLSFDPGEFTDSSDSLTLSLTDSRSQEIRELAAVLTSGTETFSNITMDDGSYYVATSRFSDLDWVFGVVVRQSDMFASVEQSRSTLKNTIRSMEIKGLILSCLTIFVALAIAFLSVKYLVMPLRTLVLATRKVAAGNLSVRCPVTTRDETGLLADSFNTMVERLQLAQEQQKQYADSLEVKVERRSSELVEKKDELETTIDQLKREVERRQIISEALKNSQQQYYETLEANIAGIYIISDGLFTYVNQSLADLLGTIPDKLVGLSPLEFVVEEDRSIVVEDVKRRFKGEDLAPYRVRCAAVDGTTFYGEIWGKITAWQSRTALVGTVTDVSNIRYNEEKIKVQDMQLRKSLEEKEILLKEIYHRTKNNMLVIISMLELQIQDIDDERILSIFNDTENRIRAMALVHEKLYQSQNLSEIDLGTYLEEVVHSLVANMAAAGKIGLSIRVEPAPINIDYAVPLGLVINEIVTNSVKHAFPNEKTGTVSLSLRKIADKEIELEIGDNGIGLPDDVDIYKSGSFGMQLIKSLIEVQLRGVVSVKRNGGTIYLITLKQPATTTRI